MFLDITELKTKSHSEIINAITRDDDSIIEMIISESISFMKGYLSARYKVDEIFNRTGTNRDQVVLKMLKAIVIYEVYTSSNPNQISDHMKDSNNRAIKWLEEVRKGNINPNLPTPEDENDPKNYIQYGSNDKRGNHY